MMIDDDDDDEILNYNFWYVNDSWVMCVCVHVVSRWFVAGVGQVSV